MGYIIGIDPGLTGAIAVIDTEDGKVKAIADIPTLTVGKSATVKKIVDGSALANVLMPFVGKSTVIIEKVAARPGNGAASVFSLGHTAGAIEAILCVLEFPRMYVAPSSWKKSMGLSDDKALSIGLAKQLYPAASEHLTRKMDHNRAEAILLATFGFKKVFDTVTQKKALDILGGDE
jgi:crossover junction endodeoxyribonuclease RuvC